MKCYVIGNGSSLYPEILDRIDAPSFGVNRIWRMFPFTHEIAARCCPVKLDYGKEKEIHCITA